MQLLQHAHFSYTFFWVSGEYGLHVGDCCVTGVLPVTDAECRDERQVTTFVTISD
jgi:hypothetical protein